MLNEINFLAETSFVVGNPILDNYGLIIAHINNYKLMRAGGSGSPPPLLDDIKSPSFVLYGRGYVTFLYIKRKN